MRAPKTEACGRAVLRTVAVLLFFSTVMLFTPFGIIAESAYLPSLFIGDEPWYKDSSAPAIHDTEGYFVPAEAFLRINGVTLNRGTLLPTLALLYNNLCFTVDTSDGTVIMPGGDRQLPLRKNGSVIYLPVAEVTAALGLGFETFVYPTGKHAVRITAGEEQFSLSALTAMYLSAQETSTRLEGTPAQEPPRSPLYADSADSVSEAAGICTENGESYAPYTVFIDAYSLLSAFDNPELRSVYINALGRIFASGSRICFCSNEPETSRLIHYILMANNTALKYFHTGTPYCSSARPLSDAELAQIAGVGLVFIDFNITPADLTEE